MIPLDVDLSQWQIESKRHHADLPRDSVILLHCPPAVALRFQEL
jgi:hypothetical protein